jgi:predicted nucleotidyltransferase
MSSPVGLAEVLFPAARLAVLKHLADSAEGLHLRELERRSGLNKHGLARELHALRDAGILLSVPIGRQVVYRLNPSCPIYEELRAIVRKTVGLAGVLARALEPFRDRIELAYIYGSQAKGDATAESGVDLMVVGDVSLREISGPAREAGRALHRIVNTTLYSPEEYRAELRTKDSFIEHVHGGVRIDLIGGDNT